MKTDSPYYPPRARWYSPLFGPSNPISRRLAAYRVRLPAGVSTAGILVGAVLPGAGFYVRRRVLLGDLVVAGYVLALAASIIWLGQPVGTWAFGVLISVHASGFLCAIEPLLEGTRLGFRLALTLAVIVVLSAAVYMPARRMVEDHWVTTMRSNGRVYLIRKMAAPGILRRGEWIAYSLHEANLGPNIYLQEGYGLGPVLGVPGDEVRFTEKTFEVNGVAHPRLHSMPSSGDLRVPERHWFVWPDLDINGHGMAVGSILPTIMFKMAVISDDQFIGKPYQRWLWRRQLSS